MGRITVIRALEPAVGGGDGAWEQVRGAPGRTAAANLIKARGIRKDGTQ